MRHHPSHDGQEQELWPGGATVAGHPLAPCTLTAMGLGEALTSPASPQKSHTVVVPAAKPRLGALAAVEGTHRAIGAEKARAGRRGAEPRAPGHCASPTPPPNGPAARAGVHKAPPTVPRTFSKVTTKAFLNGQHWGKPKAQESPAWEPRNLCARKGSRPVQKEGLEDVGGRTRRRADRHGWGGWANVGCRDSSPLQALLQELSV